MAFPDFAQSREFGERAQRWADALLFGPIGQASPVPFGLTYGIDGVGLIHRDSRDFIAVLAKSAPFEQRLDQTELLNPESDPNILRGIRIALPEESLDQVRVVRIPDIVRSATAGSAIYGALQGTAGPQVTWASGNTGFLTAGHVAVGTTNVTDKAGIVLGTTVHVFDPGTASAGGRPNVDVAVVKVASGAATTTFSTGNAITGTATIDLHLGGGPKASTVLGMIAWYVWPGVGGTYVDLYMTNAACTVPGDSGAVATNPGSAGAIGLVVGGTKTFTSFIQDIQRQIATLNTVAGLSTLSL